ncbi:MAG: hypothetical protein R3192_09455 [Woeseiaceae bacterium]|nr:hypothetical protein [Woeseiaceae bacterium]
MHSRTGLYFFRLLPVLFLAIATIAYLAHVEGNNAYLARNVLPVLLVVVLSAVTVYKGGGHWLGSGWCWPLGTLGFAIPAVGLSVYLHYGYSVNLDGMFDQAAYPLQLFRFLPAYTIVAGAVGFAIGWIVGRNI